MNVFALLMGIFLISLLFLGGVALRLRGVSMEYAGWHKQLVRWNILGTKLKEEPTSEWNVIGDVDLPVWVLKDIQNTWNFVLSCSLFGASICLLLVDIVTIVVIWLVTRTVQIPFPIAELYFSMMLGLGLGTFYGVWYLHTQIKRRTTYADVQQRKISDYRHPFLRWLPLMFIVVLLIETIVFAPHVAPVLDLEVINLYQVVLPRTPWIWGILPLIMAVIYFLLECLLMRMTAFSRLYITEDPIISRRVDTMLRAVCIVLIQCFGLVAMSELGFLQSDLLIRAAWLSHYWVTGNRPFLWLSDSVSMLFMLVQAIGLLGPALQGRLGGRLTGWPWQGRVKTM
ncbi:hypothetical protein [Tengunoibacter tsumagoiensis]|uniref:Uncharacterized protein n=1 Tax=Tengunoibacter tsumagoiensis TaxID=2014871 RepID=A0A402A2Q9_9CHLR|nr:hypothetical protein [Tengunoibacter tsumagoiensis]GCE13423.1 hypothetical protein KTT_32820 [Tengunoibacter tsumagoiensis]